MEGLSAIKATSLILGLIEGGNCNRIGVIVFPRPSAYQSNSPSRMLGWWAGVDRLSTIRIPTSFIHFLVADATVERERSAELRKRCPSARPSPGGRPLRGREGGRHRVRERRLRREIAGRKSVRQRGEERRKVGRGSLGAEKAGFGRCFVLPGAAINRMMMAGGSGGFARVARLEFRI